MVSEEQIIEVGTLKVTITPINADGNNPDRASELIKIENGNDVIFLETNDLENYSSWVTEISQEEYNKTLNYK